MHGGNSLFAILDTKTLGKCSFYLEKPPSPLHQSFLADSSTVLASKSCAIRVLNTPWAFHVPPQMP